MATSNTKRKEATSSNDLFITPKDALEAILPYVQKDVDDWYTENNQDDYPIMLDPCQGLGDIVEFFAAKLPEVYPLSNELFVCPEEDKLLWQPSWQEDFLSDDTKLANTKGDYDLILCNPPFNKAMEFVLKGFEYAPIQWHFLRLNFLEGQKRYEELFSMGKLTDVYIFTYRVSCDKGYDREETANSVSYCWYRFDNNYSGSPRLHWLTKN